jgi:hypothetical protein
MFIIIKVRFLYFILFLDINPNKLSKYTYKFITEKMLSLTISQFRKTQKSMEPSL